MAKALAARALPLLLRALAACQRAGEDLAGQARPPRPPAPSVEAHQRAGFWARMRTVDAAWSAFNLAPSQEIDAPNNVLTASQQEVRAHLRRLGGRRRIHCDPAAVTWEAINSDMMHRRREQEGRTGT